MIPRPLVYLCVLAVLALGLMAYVEPLPLLFSKMEAKMRGWNRLVVDGDRSVLDPETGVHTRQSFQLTLTRPDGIRMELADVAGDSLVDPLPAHIRQAMTVILLSHDKGALFNRLRQWGVASEPLGLSRQEEAICTIMGAYENQPSRPQFWVDKFEYFPARIQTTASIGARAIPTQARFNGWNNPVGQGFFPASVDFYRDDVLIESWSITSVDKNPGSR